MDAPAILVCVECGRESEGDARGWRAFLTDDEAKVFCPECVGEEFLDPRD